RLFSACQSGAKTLNHSSFYLRKMTSGKRCVLVACNDTQSSMTVCSPACFFSFIQPPLKPFAPPIQQLLIVNNDFAIYSEYGVNRYAWLKKYWRLFLRCREVQSLLLR